MSAEIETPWLKAALETAAREVRESPPWLRTIYARNRAIAAAMKDDDEVHSTVITRK